MKVFGGLQKQAMLLLALAIIPLAALAVYFAIDDGRTDAAQAQSAARQTVQLAENDLTRILQSTSDLILGFSQNPAFRNSAECSAVLANLAPSFPQFINLAVSDASGAVLCAARNPQNTRTVRRSPEGLAMMERLRSSRDIGISPVGINATTKQPMLPVVGLISAGGGAPGSGDDRRLYFAAGLDLHWLDDQINMIGIPQGAVLIIMDRRGKLVARNPRSSEWKPGSPAPKFETTLPGKGNFDGEILGDDGVSRLYSISRLGPDRDLTAVMKIRTSDIYRPSRNRLALHLGVLAMVGMLVLSLTWIGTERYFTRPLSLLIGAANRLAKGDPLARSGLVHRGEIGGLAHSFDEMADALQREKDRSARISETFQSIVEGTSAATGELYFPSLAANLGVALCADFVMLGEVCDEARSVSTLAIWMDGGTLENTVYSLEGTPCEGVVEGDVCHYPSGVRGLFPLDTMLADLSMESYLGSALIDAEGKRIGLIAVMNRQPMAPAFLEAEPMLQVFAGRAVSELQRLRAERALRRSMLQNEEMVSVLRALMARLESVREEERTHIAREIHDELGQQLTAMRFDLVSLRNQLRNPLSNAKTAETLFSRVSDLTGLVDSTIKDVRRIATELRPGVLDTFGLVAGIEWLLSDFGKRTGIHSRYEGPEEVKVSEALSTTIFRICQESLTNIARHSAATQASVRLRAEESQWLLEINDNGRGISQTTLRDTRSLGVVGMRERARMAGGELEIRSDIGSGTTVRATLPREMPAGGTPVSGIQAGATA